MRAILAILLAFCGATTFAQKSDPPKRKISVAEIMDKHFTAMGGLETLRALQTLHTNGSFGMPPLHSIGDFGFYYRAPASDAFRLEPISHGAFSIGHDNGAPFVTQTPQSFGGINGVTANILEANWLGLIDWDYEKSYPRVDLLGLTEINGRRAYVLGFIPKAGDRQIRYYDCETFLLVRMDLAQKIRRTKDGPEYAYKVETYYTDYRTAGGLNFPRKITATASDGKLVLEVHEVRTNVPVEDSVFHKN